MPELPRSVVQVNPPALWRERVSTSIATFDVASYGVTGPTVFLIHGWPDHPGSWASIAARLADDGYRVVVPAWPGVDSSVATGLSDEVVATLPALVTGLRELVEIFASDQPVHLIGHDWGAMAAGNLAASWRGGRISTTTLLGAGWSPRSDAPQLPPPDHLHRFWYHWLLNTPMGARYLESDRSGLVELLWHQWSPNWAFTSDDLDATIGSFGASWGAVTAGYYGHRWWWGGEDIPASLDAVSEAIEGSSRIDCHTMVIHGGADGCVAPQASEGTADHVAGDYRRVVLDNVGHFPHREAPDAVFSLLASWLREHSDDRPPVR
ncbi:alpha/beta fold hydrolase [Tsukamurella strandjordii]|nr:putative hydrolase, alpha/beta fold protein [Tsukamurella sp. TY48]